MTKCHNAPGSCVAGNTPDWLDSIERRPGPLLLGVRRILSRSAGPALFIFTIVVFVATSVFTRQAPWPAEDNPRYACYFAIALIAACLKVHERDMSGTTSMSFVFVIIALVELNLKETVLIGGSAILIQAVARKMTEDRVNETLSTLLSTLAAALVSQSLYRSDLFRDQLEAPVRLVLAVAGSFAAYNLPVALTGIFTRQFTRRRLFRSMYVWSFQYHITAGLVTALYSFMYPFTKWYAASLLVPMMYLIYQSYEAYLRRLERQRVHAERVSKLHLRTIETLALAIEAKDQTTHDHLKRVQVYAIEIGKDLALSEPELQALRAAAVLHDIGKLAVPEHILSKPGKLTPEEFDKMKIHPVVGAEILVRARFPYAVAPIVRGHHEKWDGCGYPDGLAGEAIPIGARILSAVDCLDALASDRQYRRALPLDRAMEEIAAKSGKDFDPRVVAMLQRRYRELESLVRATEPIKPLIGHPVSAGAMPRNGDGEGARTPAFLHSIGAAREEVQKLFELTQELGNSLETRETFTVLSRGLKSLVPYDAMALFLEAGDRLAPQHLDGPDSGLLSGSSLAPGGGVTGWVVQNAKPAVNCDPARDGLTPGVLQCMISVPLSGRQGVVGALSLYSRKKACYGADHLRLLKAITPKLSLAVENGLTFERAESSATTDYLTGLPNAQSLFVHLDRELELSRYLTTSLALLVCDLNGFKQINDTLGHLAGNHLLRLVGKAVQSHCREYDYPARMGGDEFVILCSGLEPLAVRDRIRDFRTAIRDAGREVCGPDGLGSSFGSAIFPEDGNTADELLAAADRKMYQDKCQVKTGAHFVRKMEKPAVDRRKNAEVEPLVQ